MARFSHQYLLAFTVESDDPMGEDITNEQFKAAVQGRVEDIEKHDGWIEACGVPIDTDRMED